jgi:hypothetical protein
LALFIGVTGTHLWGIIRFAFHQLRATAGDHDNVHYQIQVLLRNPISGASMFCDIINMSWYRRDWKTLARCLPLILLSACYMVALAAAGLLSSKLLVVPDEGLARNPLCGWTKEGPELADLASHPQGVDIANALLVAGRWSYRKSLAYSQNCYQSLSAASSSRCAVFVQPMLHSKVVKSAPCPFEPSYCASPAISIDAGRIDFDRHLGINTNPRDRVPLKKTTTCAPLLGKKVTTGWQAAPGSFHLALSNDSGKGYNFGVAHGLDKSPLYNFMFGIDKLTQFFPQMSYALR